MFFIFDYLDFVYVFYLVDESFYQVFMLLGFVDRVVVCRYIVVDKVRVGEYFFVSVDFLEDIVMEVIELMLYFVNSQFGNVFSVYVFFGDWVSDNFSC